MAENLGVTTEEAAAWLASADAVHIPYDEELGVHPQCEDFTRYAEWDFAAWVGRDPLMLHAPYFQLYRKQVVKQANLVLAMHWCGDAFTAGQKARNLDYYERRTVRDSSLSACTQSVLCAEVGQLELPRRYLHEAALMDLHDLHHNARSGIHLGCMAGAWTAVVEGLGGMRRRGEQLHLAPALPGGLTRLIFRLRWRGIRFLVEISDGKIRISLPDHGRGRLPLVIYGERVEVTGARAVEPPLRHRTATLTTPPQPPGRGPLIVTSRRDTRIIADPAG